MSGVDVPGSQPPASDSHAAAQCEVGGSHSAHGHDDGGEHA